MADLYCVTLGFREHKYALTKDLSKFYNRVDADPTAQHVRRVIWRDGDLEAKPRVFITTTVNFGDRPAGCIAIAAIRETAERFGNGSPAAWFLKNRTYVDDCIAGANSAAQLMQISDELEKIVEKGGFIFKETHKTGDPDSDVQLKVLGLIWNTERDTLRVDVRVNFAGKVGGAKLKPDLDLEDEQWDEEIPEKITKRIVWRVAQGQYDPLGLLSPYLIQLKMLMRDVCGERPRPGTRKLPVMFQNVCGKLLATCQRLNKLNFPAPSSQAQNRSRHPGC